MKFVDKTFPDKISQILPEGLELVFPKQSQLPLDQQHFLIEIPWSEKYLDQIPTDFRLFFQKILPYMSVRTTNVHTAICLSYLDEFLEAFKDKQPDRLVVGLSLILHDCGWSQLTEAEIAQSLGVIGLKLNKQALGPKDKHALEGEKIARKVLTDHQMALGLNNRQIELICKAVLYHDKPEEVAGSAQPLPIEVQLLVDLDHIWSFTHLNFWQDTVRKGVKPEEYLRNLEKDLDSYFVTDFGKTKARQILEDRKNEVEHLSFR